MTAAETPPESNGRVPEPSAFLTATEGGRAMLEGSYLLASWHWLIRQGRGDGHPVLVLPGFTAGDASTLFLRRFLRELGFEVLAWELGRNDGAAYLLPRLYRRINEIIKTTDAPFSIVGQSLGGIFAREIARSFPGHVRSVITLGSPFRGKDGEGTSRFVRNMFERSVTLRPSARFRGAAVSDASKPLPVPSTAIYSKSDGVVAWQLCREEGGPMRESIEVNGSHTGMTVHPLVFWIVADRLGQPLGQWEPVPEELLIRARRRLWMAPWLDFPRLELLHPWRSGA